MLGICSHDAGGAEILSTFVAQTPGHYLYCIDGPAIEIFNRNLKIDPSSIVSPEELIAQCDEVLCSSSWQSELELNVIDLAKQKGKKNTVLLDHWANFPERFFRPNRISLPDNIWVTDKHAFQLARSKFSDTINVLQIRNPIQEKVSKRFPNKVKLNKNKELVFLYVSEPTSQHALHTYGDAYYFGYTEFEALRHTIKHLNQLKTPMKMHLRCHPAEDREKYLDILSEANFPIELSKSESLLDDIEKSQIIIGATTMAMVMALYANRYVFTSLPKTDLINPLPFPEILPISSLNEFLEKKMVN